MVYGGVDAIMFGSFLTELVKKYPELANKNARKCLVLDNCPAHHSKKLHGLLSNLNVFFLSPWSPFCTMIEEIFALIKH